LQAPETFRPDGAKALVNVDPVGQPRDGDWRACYVLFDRIAPDSTIFSATG
jgi:hypothetical protein